jgi:hypothetical protein
MGVPIIYRVATGKVYPAESGTPRSLLYLWINGLLKAGMVAGSGVWTHFFNYSSVSSSVLASFGLGLPCFSSPGGRRAETAVYGNGGFTNRPPNPSTKAGPVRREAARFAASAWNTESL